MNINNPEKCVRSGFISVRREDGSCTGLVLDTNGEEKVCPVEKCLAVENLKLRMKEQERIPFLGVAD